MLPHTGANKHTLTHQIIVSIIGYANDQPTAIGSLDKGKWCLIIPAAIAF
jgi:hypothetical protein